MTTLRLRPELEQSIVELPGIRAVSVVTSADAQPTEIHVLSGASKPAKQVVRDVQSLAMAQYDLDIDHRIVSVVQLEDTDLPAAPAGAPEARPVLAALAMRTAGGVLEAGVTLRLGDATFEGTATGAGTASARPRLVARAALDAVRDLLGMPADVEQAVLVPLGGHTVALCVVSLDVPRTGQQLVTGSALVRGDDADALARAVLAAVNRRIGS